MSPTVKRISGADSASASFAGSAFMAMPMLKIGTPRKSRGTTFTAPRTEMLGSAPCSTRSIAISPPEFPKPITSTRLPRKSAPLRYSALCRIVAWQSSSPGQVGRKGTRAYPVATTTLSAMNCSSPARTDQPPSPRTIAVTVRPYLGSSEKCAQYASR
jgi:hypothetical protein